MFLFVVVGSGSDTFLLAELNASNNLNIRSTNSLPDACDGGCAWAIIVSVGKKTGICTKCVTKAVPSVIDLLVNVIMETHQLEIDSAHHGDDGVCTTCDLIRTARLIEGALRQ
jgi:hypothetical protein